MKKNKNYWNEIAGCLSGEMNTKEMEIFTEKMKTNKQLSKDYRLMKKTWNDFNSNPEEKFKDTGKAWEILNEKIEKTVMAETVPSVRMSRLQYVMRIAAVIILIVAIGIPVVYYSGNDFSFSKSLIEHQSKDGTATIDLPDGSRVFLNEGSTLEYHKSFEEKRDVKLEGEGYFDVMSDPKRPFSVNTGKVVITVLGTSFNIKETVNEATEVFVESGKVRVYMEKSDESLVLRPGQFAQADQHLSTMRMDNDNYLSWKTKDFKFIDESITTILDVLEDAYHVEVNADAVAAKDMKLTTSYSDQSFDAILSTICTALNMNYNKEGKVYILQLN